MAKPEEIKDKLAEQIRAQRMRYAENNPLKPSAPAPVQMPDGPGMTDPFLVQEPPAPAPEPEPIQLTDGPYMRNDPEREKLLRSIREQGMDGPGMMPCFVQEQPAPEAAAEAPAEGAEAPTEGAEAPTEGTEAPVEDYQPVLTIDPSEAPLQVEGKPLDPWIFPKVRRCPVCNAALGKGPYCENCGARTGF